jgi:hypothetical protein
MLEVPVIVISEDRRYPLELAVNDYWSAIFLCRDGMGDRISLAGYTGNAEVRSEPWPNGDLLMTFQVTLEGGDTNPLKKGEVLVEALSNQTALLDQNGVWDCILTRPGSQPIKVINNSTVSVIRSVTT